MDISCRNLDMWVSFEKKENEIKREREREGAEGKKYTTKRQLCKRFANKIAKELQQHRHQHQQQKAKRA